MYLLISQFKFKCHIEIPSCGPEVTLGWMCASNLLADLKNVMMKDEFSEESTKRAGEDYRLC